MELHKHGTPGCFEAPQILTEYSEEPVVNAVRKSHFVYHFGVRSKVVPSVAIPGIIYTQGVCQQHFPGSGFWGARVGLSSPIIAIARIPSRRFGG
jgi:hypothetical protein